MEISTVEPLERHFGHMGEARGGYALAVCEKCHAIACMTWEYRSRGMTNILEYLDSTMKCCKEPDYHFGDVYILEEEVKE